MNNSYDVAIIGCGTAGIFAGYELIARHPELKICVLDQGGDIYSRHCPIVAGKVKECIHCSVCDTMCGFGGAGAFSDGKYNFTTQFGGWLTDFMGDDEVMELINYVDTVNMKYGATDKTSPPIRPKRERSSARRSSTIFTCFRQRSSISEQKTICASSRTCTRICAR